MPPGSGPESIVIAEGSLAYVSSLKTGVIFLVDLKTGAHEVFLQPFGPTAVGLGLDDQRRLYVCGGIDGTVTVVDTTDRSTLARYQLGTEQTFVNELIITPNAVWVTDSFQPVLYKLPLGPGGELPAEDEVVRLPLSGASPTRWARRSPSASTPTASRPPRTAPAS
jgi:sugar lactone lactonase YvrE